MTLIVSQERMMIDYLGHHQKKSFSFTRLQTSRIEHFRHLMTVKTETSRQIQIYMFLNLSLNCF